jgi:hypothetical protein
MCVMYTLWLCRPPRLDMASDYRVKGLRESYCRRRTSLLDGKCRFVSGEEHI